MGFKKIKTIIEECKEFASWEKVLRLRPEAFWVFVTQVGIVVAGLIGVKMLTNLLGPSEYGRLSIANTMIALIGTSFFVPFSQGLLRFWSIAKERENLNVFYSAERKISHLLFFGALTVAVVLFLIAQYTSSLNGSLLVILALLTGTISGLISLKTGIFTANRRRAAVALLSIGTFLFRPLLAAALILLFTRNTNIALLGYLTAALIIFAIATLFYKKIVTRQTKNHAEPLCDSSVLKKLEREIFLYAWPFLVWGIFGWAYASCDRWALKLFYNNEVVGLFSVVSQFAIWSLGVTFSFLHTLFTPIAFQRAGNLTRKHSVLSAARIIMLMLCIFGIAVIIILVIFSIFHHQLIRLFSSETFTKFSYLLPGITLAWSFYYAGQLLNIFGQVTNHPHRYIMPRIAASVSAVLIMLYLLRRIGIWGIVWGWGISGFIYMIWCMVVSYNLLRHQVSKETVRTEDMINFS